MSVSKTDAEARQRVDRFVLDRLPATRGELQGAHVLALGLRPEHSALERLARHAIDRALARLRRRREIAMYGYRGGSPLWTRP